MCKYCDGLIARTKDIGKIVRVVASDDENFVSTTDDFGEIKFYRMVEGTGKQINIDRCPYCQADLYYKLQQVFATDTNVGSKSSVSEKPKKLKKIGDFTLREIQNICNDQINGCNGCPLGYVDCDTNEFVCPKDYWCDIDMEFEVKDD